MIVYCIENTITYEKYVGATTKTLKYRFKRHKEKIHTENTQNLHKAMAKYGVKNFIIYELETAESTDDLYEKEKLWIERLDTKNTGYNHTDGGLGTNGFLLSEESKAKISKRRMGKTLSEEHKLSIKNSSEGIHQGEENPFYGKNHSDESKSKIKNCRMVCIYCGIESIKGNIIRWHNENCKNKPKETIE